MALLLSSLHVPVIMVGLQSLDRQKYHFWEDLSSTEKIHHHSMSQTDLLQVLSCIFTAVSMGRCKLQSLAKY